MMCTFVTEPSFAQVQASVAQLKKAEVPISHAYYIGGGECHDYLSAKWRKVDLEKEGRIPEICVKTLTSIGVQLRQVHYSKVSFFYRAK